MNQEIQPKEELSKGMFLEVQRIFYAEFEKFKGELRMCYMSKESCEEAHKDRNILHENLRKNIFIVGIIAVVALCVGCLSMGMKIEDLILRGIGMIK
jgi:hypothetical protein